MENIQSKPLALGQRLAGLSLNFLPSFHKLPPRIFRFLFLVLDRLCGLGSISMKRVQDISIPVAHPNDDIILRSYEPKSAAKKTLVFFHSGGCVIGSHHTHDHFCRYLAHYGEAMVISVNYRLAPEHKFPVPITDSIQAWNWINDHKQQLNLPDGKIGVAGDSAGGYLSLLLNLKSEQQALPCEVNSAPAFQMVLFPMLDLHGSTASYDQFTKSLILTTDIMKYFRDHYLNPDDDLSSPLVSPLLSEHLDQIPKTYLLTVGYDPLRDEGLLLAEKLNKLNVVFDHDHFADCMHSFFSSARLSPTAKKGVLRICEKLQAM